MPGALGRFGSDLMSEHDLIDPGNRDGAVLQDLSQEGGGGFFPPLQRMIGAGCFPAILSYHLVCQFFLISLKMELLFTVFRHFFGFS